MNVTFTCPQCESSAQAEFAEDATQIECPHCQRAIAVPAGAIAERRVHRCLVCPSAELYLRKDFSQKLGLAILFLGLGTSCVTWYFHMRYATYAILGGTAILDAALWFLMSNVLQCYRCQAEYRGVAGLDEPRPFDLEVHERHRQELARLAEAEQEKAS